jgi:hypothetical protein
MSAQQKWSSSATFNFLFPHLNLFQYFHIFFPLYTFGWDLLGWKSKQLDVQVTEKGN